MPIRVTVWGEYRHEKKNPKVSAIYPKGMHEAIADGLRKSSDLKVRTAWLDQPEAGLTDEILAETDVLTWWGHMAHGDVPDAVVERVHKRVTIGGMGLVVLHSGHFSKIFKKLMGTSCDLKWREGENEKEVLWVTRPGHPILAGVDDHFVIDREEMYGEFFDIPEPEQTILISSFGGGEVFRSGCCWTRGAGKIFYFRPGHETFPTYHNPTVLKVIANGVRWTAPAAEKTQHTFGHREEGWWEKK
ncbi:MAG TPA: ThuA domain-containing protein [Tepidisphaeraceae bacterium]|jgi:trehalose utilization protein|nr:ThuA domain-containing protein [Tepidisphaeraceae bacterium]